jgi:hypothetical protein
MSEDIAYERTKTFPFVFLDFATFLILILVAISIELALRPAQLSPQTRGKGGGPVPKSV